MNRFARGLILLALIAGCGKDKARSLVPVDIVAPADLVGVASVTVTVSQGADKVADKAFTWVAGAGQPLKVGMYLPASVDGAVTVEASAADGGGTVLATSDKQPATVHPGQISSLVTLTLVRTTGGGGNDGGVTPDGAVMGDGSTGDGEPGNDGSDGATIPPDGGGSDGPGPDVAVGLTWQPAENLEHDVVARSLWPSVAIDGAGNAVLVWSESTALKSRRYDAATKAWGDIQTIENHGAIYSAQVKLGANGHGVAIWNQSVNEVPVIDAGMWASRTKDGGKSWAPPVHVHTGPVFGLSELQVARDGSARIAWHESMMNLYTLWSAHADDATGTWADVAPVKMTAMDDSNDDRHPRIAMDGLGGGILVWLQNDEKGNDSTWGTSFAPNGPLKAPQLLDSFIIDDTQAPAVAMMADGTHGVSVWVQRGSSMTNYELFSAEYTPATGWQAPARILTSPNFVSAPAVAIDHTAAVTLAWAQPLANYKSNVVSVRRPAGGAWTSVMPLETANEAGGYTDEDPYPVIGVDGVGTVHVAWARKLKPDDEDKKIFDFNYGVYSRRFTNGAWSPELLIAAKDGLRASDPTLAVGEDGHAAIGFFYYHPNGSNDPDAYNGFAALFR
jgi:hypothetical protein